MKKSIKALVCFAVAVLIIVIVISALVLEQKYSMRHYFDSWIPESDEKIVHVQWDSCVIVENDLNLEDYVDGLIKEVYCIRNERIYFSYSTAIPNSYPDRTWHIASIGVNGEGLTEHYADNLFDDPSSLGHAYDYVRLSYQSDKTNSYGGIYANDQIFLYGKDKSIVYNIKNNTVDNAEAYLTNRYTWEIDDHEKITIEDAEQNISKTITLASMAKHNLYAQKLLDLSTQKIWNGDSPTKNFFQKVKIVDDQIYFICEVLNWHGESFAVIFKYDFSSDNVLFVSSCKVGDRVSSNYSFAIWEH